MKKPKQLIIFGAIVFVVIGISATAAILLSQPRSTNQPAKKDAQATPQVGPTEKKINEADKLAYRGDVQGGVAALDDATKESGDQHAKFLYTSQKALLLFNDGKLDEALAAARQAFDFEQTTDSAAFVGQIARAKNDNKMALDYYKKALSLIRSDNPMAERDKEYYTGIVAEIEKSS